MNFEIRKKERKSEQGITLLIAVLILSAVSVISFSLGSLIIRELRISRQLTYTEPAIVAAEAGSEIPLFFRQRGLSNFGSICPTLTNSTFPSGTKYSFCNNLYDNPFYYQSLYNDVAVAVLDDPLNSSNQAAGYSNIFINATTTSGQMRAYAFNLNDFSQCPKDSGLIGVPGSGSFSSDPLDPNQSYAVFLYPCGNPGLPPTCPGGSSTLPACSSGDVRGTITGTTQGGISGIPSENPSIESTGDKNALIRKLEVFINRR